MLSSLVAELEGLWNCSLISEQVIATQSCFQFPVLVSQQIGSVINNIKTDGISPEFRALWENCRHNEDEEEGPLFATILIFRWLICSGLQLSIITWTDELFFVYFFFLGILMGAVIKIIESQKLANWKVYQQFLQYIHHIIDAIFILNNSAGMPNSQLIFFSSLLKEEEFFYWSSQFNKMYKLLAGNSRIYNPTHRSHQR